MSNQSKCLAVRSEGSLYKAWSVVRDNGLRSTSRKIREEIKDFSKDLSRHIHRINRQLLKGRFVFEPAIGLLLKKKNKTSERPVVVAPIPSRIVQRSILNVVQSIPAIAAQLKAGYNFGGIEGNEFGVPPAIEKALGAAQTSGYYIRTDIKSFFTAVPRDKAVSLISAQTGDGAFNQLLKQATDTELADMAKFGEKVKLFPLADEGVAQGSCLSPLLCNFLLGDFDREMNGRGIICIRYIDDFIIFGPDRSATFKAFRSGLKLLNALGLEAYNPESADPEERKKADHGSTLDEIEFLGCDIRRNRVRPSKGARTKLLIGVKEILMKPRVRLLLEKQVFGSKTTTRMLSLRQATRFVAGEIPTPSVPTTSS
jgi:hypothetical protein